MEVSNIKQPGKTQNNFNKTSSGGKDSKERQNGQRHAKDQDYNMIKITQM